MRVRKPWREMLTSDEGLSLVECLFALIVFSIAAGGLAFTLQAALHTSANNRLRVQAANLAARELEIDRNEFNATAAGPVTLGATGSVVNPHNLLSTAAAGSPLVIDKVPFTVARDVQWLPTGTGESPCDGGSAVTYPTLKVTTSVTWSRMGSTKPVINSTLLTPPKTQVSTTTGFIAVKVTGADGKGIDNMPVVFSKSSSSQTRFTESDGCAVFSTTDYGIWTATLNKPGYVTPDLALTRAKTATVGSGTLSQVPMSYDRAAVVNATQKVLAGYNLPSALTTPLSLYNSGLPSPGRTTVTTVVGATTAVGGLWPFADGYSSWAGSCDQSVPATRPAGVPLTAGATVSQDVTLSPIDINVRQRSGSTWVQAGSVVVLATPVSSTNCAANGKDTLTLGTTSAGGLLKASLPAGSYTISVSGRSLYTGGSPLTWPVTAANLSTTVPTTIPQISLG